MRKNEAVGEPDEEKEGAPELETPEDPGSPKRRAAKRDDTTVASREEFVVSLSKDDAMRASLPAVLVTSDGREFALTEIESLGPDLHVSVSPVNSHAPIWLPREPNSP